MAYVRSNIITDCSTYTHSHRGIHNSTHCFTNLCTSGHACHNAIAYTTYGLGGSLYDCSER